jgi:poly(hydroxyalkanoate) granule-associated protein
MVKKLQKLSAKQSTTTAATNPLASAVKDSAQQIWLAGLGAFAKAQQEGGKAFDSLVKEGLSMQRKTQAVAEERLGEASSRVASMASDISAKASGQWDKLETIFEDRVARTLNKLGVPSAQDVDALIARIDELNRNVQALNPKPAAAPKRAAAAPAVTKAPAKKAAAKKPALAVVAAVAAPAPKAPAAKKAKAAKPVKTAALADAPTA